MTSLAAFLVAYLLLAFLSNVGLVVTTYRIEAPNPAVKGFRIVQLSDIHGRLFGPQGMRLSTRVGELDPDFVVITGDLVSWRQRRWNRVVASVGVLAAKYPVYYIPGNHEGMRRDLPQIAAALTSKGVTVLQDQMAIWAGRGARVAVVGMADFVSRRSRERYETTMRSLVAAAGDAPFKVLLSHRSQLVSLYGKSGADMVFSGHAHGGQINLPGVGPLYSPDEGLMPRYTGGVHRLRSPGTERPTTLVISRGLGGLWFLPRIGNPPEIVLVVLD